MKKLISAFAALAAFAVFGIDANTMHDDIPGTATVGEIIAAGGGFDVDTNVVRDIIHATVDGSARPLPRYLHALDFADSYPDAAAEYYRSRGNGKTDGGCSAVRSGGFICRNFDFPFDDRAEFVVRMSAGHNRFASVGVAQVGTNLTEAIVTSGKPEYSARYKWLPGATVDGVNEHGVVCEINVVDTPVTGWHTNATDKAIHPLAAVRWVLDNATNAYQAATYLAANIRFPRGWEQNFHFMIADETATYIVENGNCYRAGLYDIVKPVLTNFRVVSMQEGSGIERYNLLLGGANITNAWYTRAYHRETTPPWVSDLREVLAYTNEIFDAWAAHPKEYFRGKTNNGISWWQTLHTSVYDITNRTLRIAVQEKDDWYSFSVPVDRGITEEKDPTVPSWAKQPKMPLAEEIRKGTNAITATGMKICEGEIYGPGIGYWLAVEHGLTNYLEWTEGENAWRRNESQYPQIKFNGAEIRFYESAQYWQQFRANPWEGWHSFTGWEVCYVKGRSVVTNELLTAEKDPTVPNWAKQPEPPEAMPGNGVVLTNGTVKTKDGTAIQPEHIGAGSASEMAETRAIVTTWEQFLDGSNVVFSITNYLSGTYNLDAAKLLITELRDGVYREVYNSRDEILLHIDHFSNSYVRVALDAVVEEVAQRLAGKADRAWGNHTSAGGNAPSNTVYMTAPNTVFAGGMEYERVAVGQGAVCILTTKGAPVYTQGDEGTFKFQDDGGTNYFGFAKTDSYVIGCNTDGISVQNQIVTLEYDITMSGVPCIWYRESLQDDSPWVQCNTPDGEPISGAPKVVQWDENPGAGKEICYINCSEASGFFKATVEVAGEAKFMTNMKADLNGGVLCTDGHTVIYPHANGSWSTTK